jgi:hypothetical protein
MYWVPRFLTSGLGGDPRDSIRALETIRGSRMAPQEEDAWLCVLEETSKEGLASC